MRELHWVQIIQQTRVEHGTLETFIRMQVLLSFFACLSSFVRNYEGGAVLDSATAVEELWGWCTEHSLGSHLVEGGERLNGKTSSGSWYLQTVPGCPVSCWRAAALGCKGVRDPSSGPQAPARCYIAQRKERARDKWRCSRELGWPVVHGE